MRKILLGTTAVAGAALFAVSTAQAQQAPTVRIGGAMEFNVGVINDDADKNVLAGAPTPSSVSAAGVGVAAQGAGTVRGNRRTTDFRQGDTEVHVFVTGKAANGLDYGAVIEIEFDNSQALTGGSGMTASVDEAYMFVSSPTLGTLRFGDEDSAASLMQTRVPTIAGMGPDNMWDEFAARVQSTGNPYLISGINDGSDATKIIYLSPQFAGFDFGLSFAPNPSEGEGFHTPTSSGQLQRDRNNGLAVNASGLVTAAAPQNELSAAVRYRGTFGGVGIATTLAYMQGDAPETAITTLQDIKAYHFGLALSAFGFTVGGEYNWGRYGGASTGRSAVGQGIGDSRNWAVGGTYTAGALSVGAFYGVGERDNGTTLADRQQTVWGIGAVYTLAPGLELVANYTAVADKNISNNAVNPTGWDTLRNRDVQAFIVGTRIAF